MQAPLAENVWWCSTSNIFITGCLSVTVGPPHPPWRLCGHPAGIHFRFPAGTCKAGAAGGLVLWLELCFHLIGDGFWPNCATCFVHVACSCYPVLVCHLPCLLGDFIRCVLLASPFAHSGLSFRRSENWVLFHKHDSFFLFRPGNHSGLNWGNSVDLGSRLPRHPFPASSGPSLGSGFDRVWCGNSTHGWEMTLQSCLSCLFSAPGPCCCVLHMAFTGLGHALSHPFGSPWAFEGSRVGGSKASTVYRSAGFGLVLVALCIIPWSVPVSSASRCSMGVCLAQAVSGSGRSLPLPAGSRGSQQERVGMCSRLARYSRAHALGWC